MKIKKYASHSDFKGFGCEIVNSKYPQVYSLVEEGLQEISPTHLTSLSINYSEFLDCDLVIMICKVFVGHTSTSIFSRKLSINETHAYNFMFMAQALDIPLLAIPVNGFSNDDQLMFHPTHFIIPEDELSYRLKEYNLNKDSKLIVFIANYEIYTYTYTASTFRYILRELEKYDN
jgi:hypothetical protein|nr:MAG TPA: hypothetical protein [Caudoviricetes sp.]